MGIPIAVNYANCFMVHSETNLWQDYEKNFRKEPTLRLRFIDDVFVVWIGSEAEFKACVCYF